MFNEANIPTSTFLNLMSKASFLDSNLDKGRSSLTPAVPLHFHTDDLGSRLLPVQVEQGHTVVVLDAQRRPSTYGNPGIRYKYPQKLKVGTILTIKLRLELLT